MKPNSQKAFQPSFFDKRERSLQERFERYDRENPGIYRAMLSIARRWKDAGRTHCSADFLLHILRWETGLRGADDFKINNDYAARFSRKMAADFPDEFEGFFEFRRLRAA